MTEIFNKNIKALRKKNPALAELLSTVDAEEIVVEEAKAGEKTFTFKGKYFHSRYDPVTEAKRSVELIMKKKRDWILVFGLGFGYVPSLLLEEEIYSVMIYEPSPGLLRSILESVDMTGLIRSASVKFTTSLDDVRKLVDQKTDGVEDIVQFQTAPYKNTFEKEFMDFAFTVNNAYSKRRLNINTLVYSSKSWLENYLENVSSLIESPTIDVLKDQFAGLPTLIVGAGPSLEKNAHLIKEVKGKALIVAAISAYRPLLKFGVVPDLVISAEKVALSTFFANGKEDEEVRLLLAEVSNPTLYTERKVRERYTYFCTYNTLSREHAAFWGSSYFPGGSGSVSTTALDIALYAGASPVILLGQDLSYSNNKTHVTGSVYGEQKLEFGRNGVNIKEQEVYTAEPIERKGDLLWVDGMDGKLIPSCAAWVTVLQWFEDYSERISGQENPPVLINSSEGGAAIKGYENMPFSAVIEKYFNNSDERTESSAVEEAFRRVDNTSVDVDWQALYNSFDIFFVSLGKIEKIADQIVSKAKKLRKTIESSGLSPELLSATRKIRGLEKKLFKIVKDALFLLEALAALDHALKLQQKNEELIEDDKEQALKDLKHVIQTYSVVAVNARHFIKLIKEARRSTGEKLKGVAAI